MVPTCSTRNASASSERLRCRPTVRKRGQLAGWRTARRSARRAARWRSSAAGLTRPAARVAYHRPGPAEVQRHAGPGRPRAGLAVRRARPATVEHAVPSWRTSRAGRPQAGRASRTARSPRMIAAVLAAFACNAAGRGHADRPPAGPGRAGRSRARTMWCTVGRAPPPGPDHGAGGGEPAAGDDAPSGLARCPRAGRLGPGRRRSRRASRRAGGGPATRMSPPRLTSTPQPAAAAMRTAARSAANALAVAPRSSSTPAGTRAVRRAGSSSTGCQPPRAHRRPGRIGLPPGAGRPGRGSSREVPVVAEADQ